MQQQALSAIVAWVRLERALEIYGAQLRRRFGITPLQLAVLAILSERPQLPLAALRKSLVAHPATLGQAIDALRVKGLCEVRRDQEDKRARLVAITPEGAGGGQGGAARRPRPAAPGRPRSGAARPADRRAGRRPRAVRAGRVGAGAEALRRLRCRRARSG